MLRRQFLESMELVELYKKRDGKIDYLCYLEDIGDPTGTIHTIYKDLEDLNKLILEKQAHEEDEHV